MNPDPQLGSEKPLRKSALFVVAEEVVGTALISLGCALIKSEQVAAVVLTILVGASLLALGIVQGWKNRRGPHE